MATRKVIPDTYTTYEDGHLGVVPASLANVEAKIGAALGGIPGRVYTFAGPDAKKSAKTIFKGGPLLQAIEEAFDAGSSRIYASRIGSPEQAELVLKDIAGDDALTLKGDFGTSGNAHWANVSHQLSNLETGYLLFQNDDGTLKVLWADDDLQEHASVELAAEIETVLSMKSQAYPTDDESPHRSSDFWAMGTTTVGEATVTKLWHYVGGALVGADTLTLEAGLLPAGSASWKGMLRCPVRPLDGFELIGDLGLGYYDNTEPGVITLVGQATWTSMGISASPVPNIVAGTYWYDYALAFRGEEPERLLLLLDATNLLLHAVIDGTVDFSIDISAWVTGESTVHSVAWNLATGNVYLGITETDADRVVELRIQWHTLPDPTVTFIQSISVDAGVASVDQYLDSADCTTRLTVEDRNETPVVQHIYEGTGRFNDRNTQTGWNVVTENLVTAINADGTYSAVVVEGKYPDLLMPSVDAYGVPDLSLFEQLTGGSDGEALTNADYLAGLDALKTKLDINWIHAVGATTNALWTAILVHCADMMEDHQSERFAILDTPDFSSSYEEGTAGYLTDLQDYVDSLVALAASVGDRNAVIFAGGAQFLGSDGALYNRSATAAMGGCMAALEVQKSLINKQVRNVLRLVPEFGPGHLETLIQARINCMRFKPGRGYVIAHSLTAAATGSDYSRVNDLRAVYYGSKAARDAAQLYVGEENDAAGEGLRRLEAAMSRPLAQMKDAGQIDEYDLVAVSTAADRLLGDVYVSLGIQPRRAMEMIYTTVYLK